METVAHHIHHALAQVRDLRHHILDKQRFKGYSGRARALAGTVALGAAAVMASTVYPQRAWAFLAGWGLVCLFGLGVNYGALAYWFLFEAEARREVSRLKPAADTLPALLVAAVLTAAFLRARVLWPLYGMWMCLYGLAHINARHHLPPLIVPVGLFYIFCGGAYLMFPRVDFLNPWPMGIVFFVGEWAAGLALHFDNKEAGDAS